MIESAIKRHLRFAPAAAVLGLLLTVAHGADAQSDAATAGQAQASTVDATPITVGDDAGSVAPAGSATTPSTEATATAPAKPTLAEKADKLLYAISKHPAGREAKQADWKIAQDQAVQAARAGHYDQALPTLEKLHADHPQDLGIATDYTAILGWAGRDADAVAQYQALPAPPAGENRPDYLIDSIGHAYRNLHQPDQALAVYRLGLQAYPDNQSFAGGEIFSLLEAGQTDDAIARAQDATRKYNSPEAPLAAAEKEALHIDAIELARKGDFQAALPILKGLRDKYPDDPKLAGDDVVVLSWSGKDAEAVAAWAALTPHDGQPDYVLDAAAHSYRKLRQPAQALDLYRAALKKDPGNLTYSIGEIDCLVDLNRHAEAMKLVKQQLAKHPGQKDLIRTYIFLQRREAIALARGGHYDKALAILRQLRSKFPSDATETFDYIAVSGWAGHDRDATTQYEKIAAHAVPDYVLEAVAHSYRSLHESDKALTVYKRGMKQSPRNPVFAAGAVRCLDDLGRYTDGVALAKLYTERYGDHLDVLLAGGEAANFDDEAVEALNFYERADSTAPNSSEAMRGLIHAEDRAGAPALALKHAKRHPGLVKGEEYRAIVGDADSQLVRWGPLEPTSEANRFNDTDAALTELDQHIAEWSASGDPAVTPSIMRARFDRLIALRDRHRMQDVVNDYNQLVEQGVEIPPFALEAVGEAYLSLREPEAARDIFLKVLAAEPNNFESRRLLAYAYLEIGQYDEAFATVDKLRDDTPQWIYLKGEPERQPNGERAMVELDQGELRSYADMLSDADDRMTPVVDAAPGDARNRAAIGNLYRQRGWPRQAKEQFEIGKAIQNGHDVANETGIALADLDLQHFRTATTAIDDLMQRFPENTDVQRAKRLLDVHNMAELDVHAGYQFAPSEASTANNSPNGQGFGVGAELYSAPIDYNWRLFAGQDYVHEHEPNQEGILDYYRTNAGVEYRNGNVTAAVAPTYNVYNGSERVGGFGKGTYTFNDQWSATIAGELFSINTPLRALNAGVTANEVSVGGLWRQSEERSLSFNVYDMPFSDGNNRVVEDSEFIQRLYTDPIYKLDLEANGESTHNSGDENRLYYNPKLDGLGLVGLRGTQNLYQRYETLYEHSLTAMPGLYYQQGHGVSPAWSVRYEQRIHYDDTLNAGAGIVYTHQDYDGQSQDQVSLTLDVVERF